MSQTIMQLMQRGTPKGAGRMFFNREELSRLLGHYITQVSRGHWRDYAIDHKPGLAAFSVFRHAHEQPVFVVTKSGLTGGRHEFCLYGFDRRLARSGELDAMLNEWRRVTQMAEAS